MVSVRKMHLVKGSHLVPEVTAEHEGPPPGQHNILDYLMVWKDEDFVPPNRAFIQEQALDLCVGKPTLGVILPHDSELVYRGRWNQATDEVVYDLRLHDPEGQWNNKG